MCSGTFRGKARLCCPHRRDSSGRATPTAGISKTEHTSTFRYLSCTELLALLGRLRAWAEAQPVYTISDVRTPGSRKSPSQNRMERYATKMRPRKESVGESCLPVLLFAWAAVIASQPFSFAAQVGDGNRVYVEATMPDRLPTTSRTTDVPLPVSTEPPLKMLPDCDAVRDASGRGQLFGCIASPGVTDRREGMNGLALADLNRDGLVDIVATYSPPRGTGGAWGAGESLRVFINEGNFRFQVHPVRIVGSRVSPESFGRGQVPVLADFNRDGFLDIFVTRHATLSAGRSRRGIESTGNSLLVTEGAWDTFRDVSEKMGIRNETAYNRQPSVGDVNTDGWLDIAIGCDNIGNAMGGFPHSRLYVFKPNGQRFEDGTFEDIGGTDLARDFGGFYHDSSKDKAGPDINLRDLDNDGDLDLIQSYHVDVREPLLPYSPGEYRQGIFCWRNLLAEIGALRFEKVTGNGLAAEARLLYNRDKQLYEPAGQAPGLPYVSFADVHNDGLLDVLAVGPSDRSWSPRTEYIGGRFWRNLGGSKFQEATEQAGLGALNWTYRQWYGFFDCPISAFHQYWRPRQRGVRSQPGLAPGNPIENRPYYSDALFGDFDNDGWQDLVVLDRRETPRIEARAVLFMNRGDGTFEPKPTTFSGLDSSGICGEAADLNNDGLLDLVFAADPDNSGVAATAERYESKVYWNTGAHGARSNHWLRLRFSGVTDAELIGARVETFATGTGRRLGLRVIASDQSYKSGSALEAHFGLGKHGRVDLKVTLLSGRREQVASVLGDRYLDFDLKTQKIEPVSTIE